MNGYDVKEFAREAEQRHAEVRAKAEAGEEVWVTCEEACSADYPEVIHDTARKNVRARLVADVVAAGYSYEELTVDVERLAWANSGDEPPNLTPVGPEEEAHILRFTARARVVKRTAAEAF